MTTSTDKVPNTSATCGIGSGADLNGAAVAAACVILRDRLTEIAAPMLGIAPEQVEFVHGHAAERGKDSNKVPFAKVCGHAYVSRVSGLAAAGYYKTPGVKWDWKTAEGRPFHYFACGARWPRWKSTVSPACTACGGWISCMTSATPLNPSADRGQIEGGFVQGMGWLTRDGELKWSADGKLLTHSASTYQIPAISDAPIESSMSHRVPKATRNRTPSMAARPWASFPLMLAFSVREALRDAVAAYGQAGW